jgi:peptide/nickel transport system substrate-binding protein
VFQFPGVTAYNTKIEGVDPSILSPTIFWNIWDWKVAAKK